MTSTCSAAATGLPHRRHFLSSIAGASALGLPALPSVAIMAAAQPAFAKAGDTHLLELGRRLANLNALAAEADRRLSAVEAIYERAIPETPKALHRAPG